MPINGSAIESLFDYEILSRDFIVSAPRTEKSQYDRIVDTKKKLYRVQIKARRGKGANSLVIRVQKGDYNTYTKIDTDIIALYIEDNQSWYLIPVENCQKTFRINILKDKQDRFKNNWSIFK
jgi:hypothetical protein